MKGWQDRGERAGEGREAEGGGAGGACTCLRERGRTASKSARVIASVTHSSRATTDAVVGCIVSIERSPKISPCESVRRVWFSPSRLRITSTSPAIRR